jgi:hypothetical protein
MSSTARIIPHSGKEKHQVIKDFYLVPEEGLEPSHTRVRQILREHNGVSALAKHWFLLLLVSACFLIDDRISG